MPFVALANTSKLVLEGQYLSSLKKTANVLHVNHTGALTSSQLNDLCAAVAGWFDDHGHGLFHSHWALEAIVATDLTVSTGPQVTYVTGMPRPGTVTGAPAGGQVCVITTLLTALRGRSYRGRIFWPAVPEASMDGSDGVTLDSGVAGGYDANVALLDSAISGAVGGAHLAVGSQVLGTSTPYAGSLTRTNLGTQRRRVKL